MNDGFDALKKNVQLKIGLDLNSYKEKQLKRRIIQFMERHSAATFTEFTKLLDSDPKLVEKLRNYLTINTSEFFRDIKVFELIKRKVLQELAKKSTQKLWSAGCSIGAEAYSVAILAQEARLRNCRIEATDYDKEILMKAREGVYAKNLLKNLPRDLLPKYFDAQGDKYCIKSSLKQKVSFREHNLLSSPYNKDYDVILCRNVFIYFTQERQHMLLKRFSDSLKQGGYYIIGTSEFIPEPENYGFEKRHFSIYQKV